MIEKTKVGISSCEICAREVRQPNLEHNEVIALITAKRGEHIASINKTHGRDGFDFAVTKWKKISATVLEARHSGHLGRTSVQI